MVSYFCFIDSRLYVVTDKCPYRKCTADWVVDRYHVCDNKIIKQGH